MGWSLETAGLTKRIKKKNIVEDISIRIAPGEVVGFVGPNGAGKTTTMRMILGLVSPTRGNAKVNGFDVRGQFTKAMACVGGVIEGPQMYNYLSGYDNLVHFARMNGGISSSRIQEIVGVVGLSERIHDKVKTYSLGMRQRLGLAQAILHSPSLLILDEPTNGLDPTGIRDMNNYLRKLADEEGVSVFVSSHILPEMEKVCDRIIFIQQGKVVDEYVVGKGGESDHKILVKFTVDFVSQAMACLQNTYPNLRVDSSEDSILVHAKEDMLPELNRLLVHSDVSVQFIEKVSVGLEDRYMELTRGDNHVDDASTRSE